MAVFYVPPGGFAGIAQMTPASQRALSPGRTSTSKSRRKKPKKTKSRAKRKGGKKIKFGSPAWRKKYGLGKKKRK